MKRWVLIVLLSVVMAAGCDDSVDGDGGGGGVVVGGVWNFALTPDPPGAPVCDGSALGSAVPFSVVGVASGFNLGGEWLSVSLTQYQSSVTAIVAEQHVTSAHVIANPIAPEFVYGDTITVTYRRQVSADGANGDQFRVVAVNGPHNQDVEYLTGAAVNSADSAMALTFTAASPILRIDFIACLSQVGESAVVDDLIVTNDSTGAVLLTDNFETGPGIDCKPLNPLVEGRSPAWAMGTLCVSGTGALSGANSLRWDGGSYRNVNGAILTTGDLGGMADMLGLGSGVLTGMLGGLNFSAVEPTTHYYTSFAAVAEGQGVLIGSFRGEPPAHDCVETGVLQAFLHRAEETDVSSRYWQLTITGSGINCVPAAGTDIAFNQTPSVAPGETTTVIQSGPLFLAGGPLGMLVDDYGNNYTMLGGAYGSMVTFTLVDPGVTATAIGVGTIAGTLIQGTLAGTLIFDAGRVCELSNDSAFTVTLVDRP